MRIAQVAPLYESVPPRYYGGTERVVSYLTEQLVRMGHDVTLFASGDSVTQANLVSCGPRATRLDPSCRDDLAPHVLQLQSVAARASEFDIVHFHLDYLHLLMTERLGAHVTTLHGRLDRPHLVPMYAALRRPPLVSISRSQRVGLPDASWCGTVHHGLPIDLHRCVVKPGDYFAFLGRVSPEKGLDRAIAIANALSVPLKIAAKIDRKDEAYFRDHITPLLAPPRIEFVGEIEEAQKSEFLGRARALLFPIEWPEPFGLVVIEAMACGTPVIAMRRGSVPELVEDGVTGYIADDLPSAIAAAARVEAIDRRACRAAFERRFSVVRMARDYLAIYRRLIDRTHMGPARGTREAAA
jgi:glycosyltransferase involved in cell wall biosynthesis